MAAFTDVYQILTIAGLFAAAAAVGWSTFRGTTQTRASAANASAISAMTAEIGALKDANHRLEVLVTEYKGKVELLEEHNKQLTDMIAARPEWQMLMSLVQKQAGTAARIDHILDKTPTDWRERQEAHMEETSELLSRLQEDDDGPAR